MPIANSKVPQIFDLCKVFDHKKVILICLGNSVSRLSCSRQICKLCNLIVHLSNWNRSTFLFLLLNNFRRWYRRLRRFWAQFLNVLLLVHFITICLIVRGGSYIWHRHRIICCWDLLDNFWLLFWCRHTLWWGLLSLANPVRLVFHSVSSSIFIHESHFIVNNVKIGILFLILTLAILIIQTSLDRLIYDF